MVRKLILFAAVTLMAGCSTSKTESKSIDRKDGTGDVAVSGASVTVHYTGWLWVNGQRQKQFDSSRNGSPFTFRLGAGEVIEGWDEGVAGMKVGGVRELIIPPEKGYGAQGAPPDIPPNATLCFEVELLNVSR
jgi:FKBP-type peptidyl-prolyl cis-trans isomerase